MNTANPTQLAQLRSMLLARQTALRAEIAAADRAATESNAGAPGFEDVRDTKDAADQLSNLEVDAAQRQRDIDELALVEAALQRFDAKSYGDCTDCAEPIPLSRLQVQPAAPRCAGCQAAFERQRAGH